jgi:hypothetical protein
MSISSVASSDMEFLDFEANHKSQDGRGISDLGPRFRLLKALWQA